MKIYLATTAPGNESQREKGMMDIGQRLLSYWHLIGNKFECLDVFKVIIKGKKKNESKS